MTPGERLRLFVAVDVPEELLAELETSTEDLRRALPEARWTKPDKQHVTVKFLGATDAGLLDDVVGVCTRVARAEGAGRGSLSGLGAFPQPRRARVIWVGIEDTEGSLARLAAGLDEGFEPLGFAREKRAYTPHLTLARLRPPARVTELLTAVPEREWPPFGIDHLTVYRSRLSPRGATYEVIEKVALA